MKVTRVVCALALSLTGGVGVATSAWAAPSSTLTYYLTGCTGRLGTPTTFQATKQPGGAAALHLIDGSAIFVLMEAYNADTNAVLFSTPGFQNNGLPTVTCHLTQPTTHAHLVVTGLITPVE